MGVLRLAWRYVAYQRLKTALLVASLALTVFLPLAVRALVNGYSERLLARARATPLAAGARGSRYDLILHALYFRGAVPRAMPLRDVKALEAQGLGAAIPLHARFKAQGFPVVGTSLEYFEFRGLRPAAGRLPLRLGDCVAGAEAARALGLRPDDRLLTDPENVLDLAGAYPLRMRVTGILAPNASPDDRAIFADLKTVWLIQGLGHGHQDVVEDGDPGVILKREGGTVVANAALPTCVEVTDANLASFHFHGDPEAFPVSAALLVPPDEKSGVLLRGRYEKHETVQVLPPEAVVEDLLGLVLRVKRFFDANFALVALAMALLLALVVSLSLRLRARERETLYKLGCSRGTVFGMLAGELLLVAAMSLALVALLAAAGAAFQDDLMRMLLP
ncbi:MAG: hypothetical protein M5U26_05565 [Planctomycetota bacterium]|nr:hypothetical protein [Planctomycetota bacterium]